MYYKVFGVSRTGRLTSSFARGEWLIHYEPFTWTQAKVGKIWIYEFSDQDLSDYIDGLTRNKSRAQLWKCMAENVQAPTPKATLHFSRWRNFWDNPIEFVDTYGKLMSHTADNTVWADKIRLIKRVY